MPRSSHSIVLALVTALVGPSLITSTPTPVNGEALLPISLTATTHMASTMGRAPREEVSILDPRWPEFEVVVASTVLVPSMVVVKVSMAAVAADFTAELE